MCHLRRGGPALPAGGRPDRCHAARGPRGKLLIELREPVQTDPVEALDAFVDAPCPRIVVAVSGGSDSTALLIAAARRLGPSPLLAVTVDHGLRPKAEAEARAVAALCDTLNVPHRSVRVGPPPAGGTMAWARNVRREVLVDAAGPGGVALLGHTADDVAETVAMRAARGPGPGLSGIAPATLADRTWLYRPLLAHARAALRDWLSASGCGWHDDPTNADPRYERARVRGALSDAERADALAVAARSRARREAEAARAAKTIAGLVSLAADTATLSEWRSLGAERTTVLRTLLPLVADRPHSPSGPALAAALAALDGGERFTLGGCLLTLRRGTLHVEREARAVRAAEPVPRIVPSFDWPLYRVLVPDAARPPVPFDGIGR